MDNSLVYAFEGYVDAVFKDIAPTYCSVRDWERDKNRSLHELANRGVRFLTVDLPALRKHLDKCLEDGLYTPSHLFLSKRASRRLQVPAFGKDLYLQIFDQQGKLRSEPNVCAIADLRQLFEGVGKLFLLCKQEAIDDEISNFITIENELRQASLPWEVDNLYEGFRPRDVSFMDGIAILDPDAPRCLFPSEEQPVLQRGEAHTLQRVCDYIVSQFGDMHLERDDDFSSERPKHGSGRVSNLHRHHSKYDFRYWPAKLDRIFPYDWYATHDLGYGAFWDDPSTTVLIDHEQPSKLIAVPKTMSGPRLIGSEPNYHQWIQQLVRAQIEARIKSTVLANCVSFGDQQPNRDLAQLSSIDGYFATVDLKSASDRLSCWTVERALRANKTFIERIHASRTRMMKGTFRDSPFSLMLKKCFTQGSACTFPVQTVVYSMVAISAIIITDGDRVNQKSITRASNKVRVFGDDIILPSYALQKLTEILEFLQLKVNPTKTFHKGRFRESCGMDAFAGIDVTPARLRSFSVNPSHDTAISMLEGSNNFFKRGMWHVSEWIRSYLRRYDLPIVRVSQENLSDYRNKSVRDSGGYASFCGESYDHLKKRYNKVLHRDEVRYHYLASNSKKVPTQSAHDTVEFLFGSKAHKHALDYLEPVERSLGVVDKNASVMKQGWKPFTANPAA